MALANESVPVAVFEFGFGIFLNFDKIIGFSFSWHLRIPWASVLDTEKSMVS